MAVMVVLGYRPLLRPKCLASNPKINTEQLRYQLDQLHAEAETTRAKASNARLRFLRLSDAAEKLPRQAAVSVQRGKENEQGTCLFRRRMWPWQIRADLSKGCVQDLKGENWKLAKEENTFTGLWEEAGDWGGGGGGGSFGGFCHGLGRLKEIVCDGGRWKEESGESKESQSLEDSGGEEIYGVKKEMEYGRETVDWLVMEERELEGERRRVVVMVVGAITVKETQLIGNIAADSEISGEDYSSPVRIISPKERVEKDKNENKDFHDALNLAEDQKSLLTDDLPKQPANEELEEHQAFPNQQLNKIEQELVTILYASTFLLNDEKPKNRKAQQTRELLKSILEERHRITNIRQMRLRSVNASFYLGDERESCKVAKDYGGHWGLLEHDHSDSEWETKSDLPGVKCATGRNSIDGASYLSLSDELGEKDFLSHFAVHERSKGGSLMRSL
ncbi:hypothetical protein CRYUN_Cryun24cG0089700 [Craigia yunnanensis]